MHIIHKDTAALTPCVPIFFFPKEKQNSYLFQLLYLHSNLGPEDFHDLTSLSASSEGENKYTLNMVRERQEMMQ